jgi:hypothetical protein
LVLVSPDEFFFSPGPAYEGAPHSMSKVNEKGVTVVATLGKREYDPTAEPSGYQVSMLDYYRGNVVYPRKPEAVEKEVVDEESKVVFANRFALIGGRAITQAVRYAEIEGIDHEFFRRHGEKRLFKTLLAAGLIAVPAVVEQIPNQYSPMLGIASMLALEISSRRSFRKYAAMRRSHDLEVTRKLDLLSTAIGGDLIRVIGGDELAERRRVE